MNKKGLSYVDWTVSFGIFILSILSLFVIIGPSLYKTYSGEYLLSIAQQGLEENIYYEIDSYPLFIVSHDQYGVDTPLSVEIPSNFIIEGGEGVRVYGYDGTMYSSSLTDNSLYFGPNIPSTNDVYVYYVLHSSEFDYIGNYDFYTTSCSNSNDFDCTFGVKETLRGLSEDKISFFSPCTLSTYASLKQEIAYPEKREFSINISSSSTNYFNCQFKKPNPSDNVYAISWLDYVLNEDGLKEPVTINLRVW